MPMPVRANSTARHGMFVRNRTACSAGPPVAYSRATLSALRLHSNVPVCVALRRNQGAASRKNPAATSAASRQRRRGEPSAGRTHAVAATHSSSTPPM